jgi:PepSY-associated transmembrane protein
LEGKLSGWQQWLKPQTLWVYNTLFQIHFWIGAVTGLYLALMSVTGSIIVYRNELSRWTSVEWIVKLHSNLLLGSTGRLVNGIGGICLTLLCLTGAIIWWPGVKNWRRSLTVSWGRNFRASIGTCTARLDSSLSFSFCCEESPESIFLSRNGLRSCSFSIPLTGLPTRACFGSPGYILEGSAGLPKLSGPLQGWYPPCWRSRYFHLLPAGNLQEAF